eukprot:UN11122
MFSLVLNKLLGVVKEFPNDTPRCKEFAFLIE